jgi:tripartite ATP-independent transporter DctM subunit
MALALLLGVMLALTALGIPLVFSLLGASVFTLFVIRPELPLTVVPQLFIGGIDSFVLLAIALFFLAGELMTAGGVVDRILTFARALVGHVRGGLGQVSVVSSVVMAGVSGSAVADAAAVGPLLIRSMKREGYPAAYSAALIETASTLGPIIPPSIPMIIYAVTANVSVGAMFMAGILPGLLIAIGLSVIVYLSARRMNLPRSERAAGREVLSATVRAALALLAPVIIVGGIRGGIFTPTEAGAIAVVYVLLIGVLAYRALSLSAIYDALVRAAHATGTVLVILGASSIFAWIIADQRIGQELAETIRGLDLQPWMLLLVLNLIFFAVGMFLDPLPALVILVPVFLPMVKAIGMDPVHFGVMLVLNLVIGLCTPPVGALIYLTASIGNVSPTAVVRASLPFLAMLICVLLLVTYVPAVSLTLPQLIAGR